MKLINAFKNFINQNYEGDTKLNKRLKKTIISLCLSIIAVTSIGTINAQAAPAFIDPTTGDRLPYDYNAAYRGRYNSNTNKSTTIYTGNDKIITNGDININTNSGTRINIRH